MCSDKKKKTNPADESIFFNADHTIRQADDLIFIDSISSISEFPSFITGYDDIEHHLPDNIATEALKRKTLDSRMRRKSGDYVNIEHQTIFNNQATDKSAMYFINNASQYDTPYVDQFIFYTGDKKDIVGKIKDYPVMKYHPKFFITQERNAREIFKKIKRKIENKQTLKGEDYIDLIWLVRYKGVKDKSDYINNLKKSTLIWSRKYIGNEEEIVKIRRRIGLMEYTIPTMEEMLQVATVNMMIREKDAAIAEKDAEIKRITREKDAQIKELEAKLK